MFTIDWKPNGKERWYYVHDKFVFKKERLGNVYIYKIYEHEEVMYNTHYEHEFNKRAKHVVLMGTFPTGYIVRSVL